MPELAVAPDFDESSIESVNGSHSSGYLEISGAARCGKLSLFNWSEVWWGKSLRRQLSGHDCHIDFSV